MNALLPLCDYLVLTSSGHPRASDPDELVQLASELGFKSRAEPSVVEAIREARHLAGAGDLVCVTGSIFVVGDLLNHWESLQSQLWVEK
jgi:dihydrofolate synthase/folylpolyglutamate synthase